MQDDQDEDIPIGSTKESLGKIDFEEGVPLDREEESARKVDALQEQVEVGPQRTGLDVLLRTRLRDLNPRKPILVPLGTSVARACQLMREGKVGCVLVMEADRLAGIFTERDVVYKVTCQDRRASETPIEAVMTANPTTLGGDHRLAHALNKMSVDGCRHLPIVDDRGQPVGVVSVRRIVDFLAEQFPEKLLNQPPDVDQEMPTREGG